MGAILRLVVGQPGGCLVTLLAGVNETHDSRLPCSGAVWRLTLPVKPEGWSRTPAAMAAAAAEHGQRILGPSLGEGDMIPAAYLDAA